MSERNLRSRLTGRSSQCKERCLPGATYACSSRRMTGGSDDPPRGGLSDIWRRPARLPDALAARSAVDPSVHGNHAAQELRERIVRAPRAVENEVSDFLRGTRTKCVGDTSGDRWGQNSPTFSAAQIPQHDAPMNLKGPMMAGWQPCPHCYAQGWITRATVVRGERLAQTWRCDNCRHEWPCDDDQRSRMSDQR